MSSRYLIINNYATYQVLLLRQLGLSVRIHQVPRQVHQVQAARLDHVHLVVLAVLVVLVVREFQVILTILVHLADLFHLEVHVNQVDPLVQWVQVGPVHHVHLLYILTVQTVQVSTTCNKTTLEHQQKGHATQTKKKSINTNLEVQMNPLALVHQQVQAHRLHPQGQVGLSRRHVLGYQPVLFAQEDLFPPEYRAGLKYT